MVMGIKIDDAIMKTRAPPPPPKWLRRASPRVIMDKNWCSGFFLCVRVCGDDAAIHVQFRLIYDHST